MCADAMLRVRANGTSRVGTNRPSPVVFRSSVTACVMRPKCSNLENKIVRCSVGIELHPLPTVMGKGTVGLRHLVRVFAFLQRQCPCCYRHRGSPQPMPASSPAFAGRSGVHDPPQRQCFLSFGRHLEWHLMLAPPTRRDFVFKLSASRSQSPAQAFSNGVFSLTFSPILSSPHTRSARHRLLAALQNRVDQARHEQVL